MNRKKIGVFLSVVSLSIMAGCGSTPGNSTATTSTPAASTNAITFSVTNPTSPSISVGPSLAKEVSPSIVTSGSVSCVSKTSDGTKTTKTGTLNSNGQAVVSGIPNSQETVCYLLNASGGVSATNSVVDSSAIGGARDPFKVSGGISTSASVSYNSTTGSSQATCSDCSAAASGGSSAADISGTWNMQCNAVRVVGSDAVDTSQTCSSSINGQNVFLHRVTATDNTATVRYGYGAWISQSAFTKCGSTEGLQSLPSGWSVSTSGQTGDFGWSAPFASFSGSSTSAQISTMIQSFTTANGVAQSFSTYQTANCTGLTANQCAGMYYWSVVISFGKNNTATACWPSLKTIWTSNNVTFSPRSALGGTTQPMGRHDFMPNYTNGDDTYMKSFTAETNNAYDTTNNKSVECLFQQDLLIAFKTSTTTPTTGSTASVKFTSNKKVAATSGVAADTTVCQSQVGSNSTFANNGTYLDMTMTKQ